MKQSEPNVVYPDSNGVCPSTHPQAFIQMTYEWFPIGGFPFDPSREDNWVLSFGDTSGFGFHGDFGEFPVFSTTSRNCESWNVTQDSSEDNR